MSSSGIHPILSLSSIAKLDPQRRRSSFIATRRHSHLRASRKWNSGKIEPNPRAKKVSISINVHDHDHDDHAGGAGAGASAGVSTLSDHAAAAAAASALHAAAEEQRRHAIAEDGNDDDDDYGVFPDLKEVARKRKRAEEQKLNELGRFMGNVVGLPIKRKSELRALSGLVEGYQKTVTDVFKMARRYATRLLGGDAGTAGAEPTTPVATTASVAESMTGSVAVVPATVASASASTSASHTYKPVLALDLTVYRTSLRLPYSKTSMVDLLIRVESQLPTSVRFVAWAVQGFSDEGAADEAGGGAGAPGVARMTGSRPQRMVCDAGSEELTAALQAPWEDVLQQKGIAHLCAQLSNHLWVARTTRGTQLMLRGQRPMGQLLQLDDGLAGEALFVVKSLEVTVVKAQKLPLMDKVLDGVGSCDPYAVVVFEEEDDGSGSGNVGSEKITFGKKQAVDLRKAHEKNKFATNVMHGSLDPVWKERFLLKGFTTRSGATLTINVFDHDPDDDDDLVGSATIDVPKVGARLGERSYKLKGDDGVTERGSLFVSMRWKA